MLNHLHLAWAHARHHRWRSLLLTFCLTVAFLLPATTRQLMVRYERDLSARAEATPLVNNVNNREAKSAATKPGPARRAFPDFKMASFIFRANWCPLGNRSLLDCRIPRLSHS